jgi:hypothetical protein
LLNRYTGITRIEGSNPSDTATLLDSLAASRGIFHAMANLRRLSFAIAFLITAGEIARYWGRPAFIPMALDELAVAAALVWAAWRAAAGKAEPLVAAWGAFCGLMLVLLVQNADHLIHDKPKANAWVYVAALSALLLVGLAALRRALRLTAGERSG